ncbi:hypothetical protein J3R30DRAFT_3488216 [Lentinula aciculospora]|uniref:SET domain-containing protein n=1 Tax=Lentinula aciculospora TaxID=153920 RepID=A0A9W9DLY2_9AGAR|nr:hypothetical protein J3R30DRAFT_3488216 [Lentinula aciculospora]
MRAHKKVVEPSHWPQHLRYIQSHTYHSSISSETRKSIEGGTSRRRNSFRNDRYVTIRHITDPSHPACNQFGLFALKKIPAKAHILDYIGEIHADERLTSDYDLSLVRLPAGESIGIDASRTGNEARFINDYRGIKLKPNAVFMDYRTDLGELRMGIWAANEDIKKGDELLVSYGKAWWKARTEQL